MIFWATDRIVVTTWTSQIIQSQTWNRCSYTRCVRMRTALVRRPNSMKRSKLTRPSGLVVVPRILALSCGVFGVGFSAEADSILLPADLKPGQIFQVAFVTNGTLDAKSNDIAVYNNFVTLAAAAAGLDVIDGQAVTWHAVMSTAAVNARDNAQQLAPVYDVETHLITALPGGLWNTTSKFLKHPIDFTEAGDQLAWGYVWTGSDSKGMYSPGPSIGHDLNLWGMGELVSIFPNWIHSAYLTRSEPYHLYALSSPITVPDPDQDPGGSPAVPEPASLRLGIFGLLPLLARRAFERWKARADHRKT